jgi:hypothetical protein
LKAGSWLQDLACLKSNHPMKPVVEEMVKQVGETADLAVVTSTHTVPNQTASLAAPANFCG